jgi:hypothetical protein
MDGIVKPVEWNRMRLEFVPGVRNPVGDAVGDVAKAFTANSPHDTPNPAEAQLSPAGEFIAAQPPNGPWCCARSYTTTSSRSSL